MSDIEDDGPDTATYSMFGDAEMGPEKAGYEVLARKYRPRLFSDLIGQEAMVRTLSNAFETGRIAHAFMMTGVRGVGKTTTARLLARSLNYRTDEIDSPSISLDPAGEHCQAIMESRHPDVLELDAASRTGVADMRELLDGVRYSPVLARYKVYIIDEVHMLSTAAFNALLKTLEEPPEHVKFIFATTEIRKVPVTVLSRCQRFDLKRLDPVGLAAHLGRVAEAEGAKVSEEGLALIARAAEGSVRDGLSILDQALVQTTEGEEVSAIDVRDMLGLADRARLLDLFDKAISGDAKSTVEEVTGQIHDGADPLVIIKDLIDIAADVSTAKALGDDYDPGGPSDWIERTRALAQKLTPAQAARYWQLLLNGYGVAQNAPDIATAARMVVLRLVSAASLPSPEEAARMIAAGGGAGQAPSSSPNPANSDTTGSLLQASGNGPTSFDDIVSLMDVRREAILSSEVSQFVRPVSCGPGALVCDVKEGAPGNLLARIASFLEADTGLEWSVTRSDERSSTETLKERHDRVRAEKIAAAAQHPSVKQALALFPGSEITDVRVEAATNEEADGDNIVPLDDRRSAKG
ncbi:MAG: DNA polymerase III subunit gamma/tau [Pseudomonadota bacterium]